MLLFQVYLINHVHPPMPISSARLLAASTIVAGTLDLLAAFIQHYARTGKSPAGVLRYISSALFGKAAFKGGSIYLVSGVAIHYLITLFFAVIFLALYRKMKPLSTGQIMMLGTGYGLMIWCIMNLVMIPLSAAPALSQTAAQIVTGILFVVCLVGIPIAWITHYFLKKDG